ncbi:tetratricopeptide repeat protein [Flagellimonas sp. 389]|nr:tetratricopeptide repeat protein [Flagellimonas sp. 389]MBS9461950.1 tetratricopeptide repeat protein [Flagellimonas sp. 389]
MSITIKSQSVNAIDSLKNELSLHKENDTVRINLLNNLAFSCHRKDIGKTIKYIKESEELAEAIGFKKGKAKAIYIKGTVQVILSDFDKALQYYEEAMQLYTTIDFKIGVSESFNGMGTAYYYKGNYKKAIELYKESLRVDEEIENWKNSASSIMNIGSAYADLGNYTEAIAYYKKALKINREYKYEEGISKCLNNIGIVYDDQGNLPLALEYYNKSLFLSKKNGDTLGISKSLNNIGIIYKNLENYDKALENYRQSLAIQEKNGNVKNIGKLKNNIGIIYKRKKEYSKAMVLFNEALNISREINDLDNISVCLNNIGDIHLLNKSMSKAHAYYEESKNINIEIEDQYGLCNSYLGIASTYYSEKKYKKALLFALKSIELSNKLKILNYQRDTYQLLFNIHKDIGDYRKALSNHEMYKVLEDSLFNKESIERAAQLENEYKYKHELELANTRETKLAKTIKTTSQDLEVSQRNSFIAIIVVLLVSIVLGSIIFFLKLRHVNAKNQNIVIEQKLLRSQMTPHFIFNSLSILQGMILSKDDKKSISYISKFSKLLRTILENSRQKTVSLSKELSAIESYIALQNLDTSSPYNYNLSMDLACNNDLLKIPPMLIQPFIENAIEHAFCTKKKNREINVRITLNEGRLKCSISDNGIGINAHKRKTNKNKSSLATTITSERLATLSKDFKARGTISVKDRSLFGEQGTLVILTIPYKMDEV